jgi:hypothetical protein
MTIYIDSTSQKRRFYAIVLWVIHPYATDCDESVEQDFTIHSKKNHLDLNTKPVSDSLQLTCAVFTEHRHLCSISPLLKIFIDK